MYRKYLFYLYLFVSLGSLKAQNTQYHQSEDRYFRTGLELFEQGKFSAAREQFEQYLRHGNDHIKKGDANYYIAFCALNLDNADGAQLISDFVKGQPNHPKAAKAYYNLGINHFKNKEYEHAIQYLKLARPQALTSEEQTEVHFKIGFSHYAKKQMKEAARYFDMAKRSEGPYFADANYYAGYLAYQDEQYDKALLDLKRAETTKKYQDKVPIMIASAYYRQERYSELLTYTEGIVHNENARRKIRNIEQIYLLTGEALYKEQQWKEAADYFVRYMNIARKNIPVEVMYRLGYAQYQDNQSEAAVHSFKRVALSNTEIAQYASYYLGQLYVGQENFLFAASAFDKARKMDFNREIKEESAFNYAKVNFQANKYSQAIIALDDFIKKYPNSDDVAEANSLLSEAFLNTNDYARAIRFMEKIKDKSVRIKEAYQKVTFYKGTEFYNNARYFNAVQLFNKSLSYPMDKDLTTAAHFWKGEAFATAKAYPQAIESYQAVFSTRHNSSPYSLKANYGIAYAYYNSQDYKNARIYFKRYVDRLERATDKLNYHDALIRLADCYYVDKAYASALSYYDKAIASKSPDTDYAYFQKGVVKDFQDKNAEAIRNLDQVIQRYRQSRYYDDAVYKKAQIQLESGSYREAIQGFTGLIDRLQQSPFVPYAYESRALAYFNLKEYGPAERDYKTILDHYITSRVSNSALLGLQNVLTVQNKTVQFNQYLSKYKVANPDNEDLESIEFESAKSLYFSQEYDRAISAFTDYVKNYPQSGLSYEAKFYTAESYYRQDQFTHALAYYYEVYRDNQISGMDRVFERIGELELKAGQFREAAAFYTKLEKLARNKRQQSDAWAGLLEAYLRLAEYDSMRTYANTIIEKGSVSPEALNKAHLYLGKASYAQGDFNSAIDEFIATLNVAKDQYGAEAQYMIGLIFYQQKQYQQSLNTLFEINENFSAYDDWLGKAFLLIADNYIALEELFQAKATLNSIIEYSPVSSIVEQARQKIVTVEKLEKTQVNEAIVSDSTENNK